jgi:hypothetical protein
MQKVVRSLARFFLWALTAAVPFVIAACYGVMYSFSRSGRVTDAVTGSGIRDIRVTCLSGTSTVDTATTEYDGSYALFSDVADCDQIRFEDVDGAANGSYQARTVDVTGIGDVDVALTPEP